MTIYAEQILMEKKINQFFIQFSKDSTDDHVKEHINWFSSYFVPVQKVASIGDIDDDNGFYHIGFTDTNDNRLLLYTKKFENQNGESLYPEYYQLFEWSYEQWKNQNGPEKFQEWLASV